MAFAVHIGTISAKRSERPGEWLSSSVSIVCHAYSRNAGLLERRNFLHTWSEDPYIRSARMRIHTYIIRSNTP